MDNKMVHIIEIAILPSEEVIWKREKNGVDTVSQHTVLEVHTVSYNPMKGSDFTIKSFAKGVGLHVSAFFQRYVRDKKKLKREAEKHIREARESGLKKATNDVKTLIKYKLDGVKDLVSAEELRPLTRKPVQTDENDDEEQVSKD